MLDTSYIISLYLPKNKFHEKAKKIEKKIENEDKIVTKMTIYETLTVLRKLNQNDSKLKKVYESMLKMIIIDDYYIHENALTKTLTNNIGFFDNLSYVVMKNNGIKEIASFDTDFDIFKDIKRIF
jgi:predicted nucleic acid-binding protein